MTGHCVLDGNVSLSNTVLSIITFGHEEALQIWF